MLTDRWFKTEQRDLRDIKVGDVFRHRLPGNGIETAYVLDVAPDYVGIPHVIYDLCLEVSHLDPYLERRTLGLESFNERFEELIS
jgi:hypothetical protein